jgi:hypothetical protein
VISFITAIASKAQGDTTQVWTNQTWLEAKEDIEYIKKEKKKAELEFDEIEFAQGDAFWSFDWLDNPAVKFIVIGLVIILLIVALIYLLRGSSISDKKVTSDLDFQLAKLEEEVLESDFDKYLRLALEKEDYRIAVRILFLQLLQKMHENSLIFWKKDKTNQDFLNETRQKPNYVHFRDLTLAFEIVWYGDQKITKEQFNQLQLQFNSFKSKISS